MKNLPIFKDTHLWPLTPLWWRFRVTTDRPVAKETREMVTP